MRRGLTPIFDATLRPAMAWSVAHLAQCQSQRMDHVVEEDGPAFGGNNHALGLVLMARRQVYLSMKRVWIQMPAPFVMLSLSLEDVVNELPQCQPVLLGSRDGQWSLFVVRAKCGNGRSWLRVVLRPPFEGLNDQVLWKPPLAVAKNEAGGISANDAAAFRACLKMQYGLGPDSVEHRIWECVRAAGFRAELIELFTNRYRTMMQRRDPVVFLTWGW